MLRAPTRSGPRNRLLAAFPPDIYARVAPHLMRVELERRQVLYDYGAPIDRIFFPETLVASEVRLLQGHSEPDPLAGLRMQEDGLSTLTSPEHSARNGDS